MQDVRKSRRLPRVPSWAIVYVVMASSAMLWEGSSPAMMCNVKRPYAKERRELVPTFSRVRAGMLFKKGDVIEIFAFPRSRPIRGSWKLTRNMVAKPFAEGEGEVCMDQTVRMVIPPEKLTPGFYDVHFTIHSTAKHSETGRATFGWRIEDMPITASRPKDFEAFWRKAKKQVYEVPLNAAEQFVREMTSEEVSRYNIENASIPEEYDPKGRRAEKVRLYKVQFDSTGGRRMYAWLAKPVGKGPFPTILVLPGAGSGQIAAPVEHARHGYVALMLQVHGQDVDLKKYKPIRRYEGPPEKKRIQDDKYYHVYLSCVQAVRYLRSRDDVDADRLAVAGGSQGGLLTVVTAALCPDEVKAAASSICYWGYLPFWDHVRALNKRGSDGVDEPAPPFDRNHRHQNIQSYYDAMNFAPMVKAPIVMSVCMIDTASPVTTVYAIYQNLGNVPKELHWSPGTHHDLMFAFERRAWRWFDEHLGLKKANNKSRAPRPRRKGARP